MNFDPTAIVMEKAAEEGRGRGLLDLKSLARDGTVMHDEACPTSERLRVEGIREKLRKASRRGLISPLMLNSYRWCPTCSGRRDRPETLIKGSRGATPRRYTRDNMLHAGQSRSGNPRGLHTARIRRCLSKYGSAKS